MKLVRIYITQLSKMSFDLRVLQKNIRELFWPYYDFFLQCQRQGNYI